MNDDLIIEFLGWKGNLLSYSKSDYRDKHPDNIIVFNSNVCVGLEKVWYGDLDITLSKNTLIEMAIKLKDVVFVLYEMDGRGRYDDEPNIGNYVVKFNPDGTYVLNERLKQYYSL